MSSRFVGFCGSRSVSSSQVSVVSAVVRSFVSAGRGVAVGCCVGVDEAVLYAASSLSAPVRVFAQFAASGEGAWALSAVSAVSVARRAGAVVCWEAGGSVSSVPLGSRLAARSRALALSGLAGLVAFVHPSSRGSWVAVRAASRAGVPVVVVPFRSFALPSLGAGSWVSVSLGGVAAFRWAPVDATPQQAVAVNVSDGKFDECDVYCGRSKNPDSDYLGNPYTVQKHGRGSACDLFEADFYNRINDPEDPSYRVVIETLKHQRLGCFCAPRRCHCDVIAGFLNNPRGLTPPAQPKLPLAFNQADQEWKALGGNTWAARKELAHLAKKGQARFVLGAWFARSDAYTLASLMVSTAEARESKWQAHPEIERQDLDFVEDASRPSGKRAISTNPYLLPAGSYVGGTDLGFEHPEEERQEREAGYDDIPTEYKEWFSIVADMEKTRVNTALVMRGLTNEDRESGFYDRELAMH